METIKVYSRVQPALLSAANVRSSADHAVEPCDRLWLRIQPMADATLKMSVSSERPAAGSRAEGSAKLDPQTPGGASDPHARSVITNRTGLLFFLAWVKSR
jgi:hypothetical protein